MHDHHIEEIIDVVAEAVNLTKKDRTNITTLLNKKFEDQIAVFWMLDDVKQQAGDMEIEITDDQARDVLSLLLHKHDAGIGINWDTIGYWIEHVKGGN